MLPIPSCETEMSNLIAETSKQIVEAKDPCKPATQRTGNFGTRSIYIPAARLQPLFHQIISMIETATNDDRDYTVEIKIVTTITVGP